MISRFNIRVYMLVIDHGSILISDEMIQGKPYTKFPGGGLEYGEGILDCLFREASEEFGQTVENQQHFYTTDFYQESAFHAEDQVISVYYTCQLSRPEDLRIATSKFDFVPGKRESFRWESVHGLEPDDLSFPIDRVVLKMLKG